MELTKKELTKINGGGFGFGALFTLIGAGITFVIGIIDGPFTLK